MTPQEREDAALASIVARAARIEPGRTEPYGPHPDQVIEWYAPLATHASPLVLVHGGFFRPTIDRSHLRPLARALADRLGAPVVLAEYRRVPGQPAAAVADLRAVSDLLEGLDEVASIWVGHSAGGTLALQRALDPVRPGVTTLALAPVADLRSALSDELGGGAVREWLGARTAAKPSRYAHLDPVRLLAELPERGDLIHCVHGQEDLTVPLSQSRSLGLSVIEVPGAHHYDVIDPDAPFFADLLSILAGSVDKRRAGPPDR